MDVLCCTASILHLVAIAIDRYWAITRVDYVRGQNKKPIYLMIIIVWILSLAISLPTRFHTSRNDDLYNDVLYAGECNINKEYIFTIFSTVVAFYMPMAFLIGVYVKIYQAARERIRKKRFRSPSSVTATMGTGKGTLSAAASSVAKTTTLPITTKSTPLIALTKRLSNFNRRKIQKPSHHNDDGLDKQYQRINSKYYSLTTRCTTCSTCVNTHLLGCSLKISVDNSQSQTSNEYLEVGSIFSENETSSPYFSECTNEFSDKFNCYHNTHQQNGIKSLNMNHGVIKVNSVADKQNHVVQCSNTLLKQFTTDNHINCVQVNNNNYCDYANLSRNNSTSVKHNLETMNKGNEIHERNVSCTKISIRREVQQTPSTSTSASSSHTNVNNNIAETECKTPMNSAKYLSIVIQDGNDSINNDDTQLIPTNPTIDQKLNQSELPQDNLKSVEFDEEITTPLVELEFTLNELKKSFVPSPLLLELDDISNHLTYLQNPVNYVSRYSIFPTNCDDDDGNESDDTAGDWINKSESINTKRHTYPISPHLSSMESLLSVNNYLYCPSVYEQSSLLHIKSPYYDDLPQKLCTLNFENLKKPPNTNINKNDDDNKSDPLKQTNNSPLKTPNQTCELIQTINVNSNNNNSKQNITMNVKENTVKKNISGTVEEDTKKEVKKDEKLLTVTTTTNTTNSEISSTLNTTENSSTTPSNKSSNLVSSLSPEKKVNLPSQHRPASSKSLIHKNINEAELQRERIENSRERKAARTLAIITGCFILCWLPFFLNALIEPFCFPHCNIHRLAASFLLWLGYLNSLLNPILYTVFAPDFRNAFRKIICGKFYTNRKR
ncbi:unnamed protein product [Trichobilharzia szidati]|nr:unnamed protein product [Trichobilharzia szidati]